IAGLQAARGLAARRGPLQRLALLILLRTQGLADGLGPADAVDRREQARAVDRRRRGGRSGGALRLGLGGRWLLGRRLRGGRRLGSRLGELVALRRLRVGRGLLGDRGLLGSGRRLRGPSLLGDRRLLGRGL